LDRAIDAVSSVTIGDAVSGVKSLASFVTENWGSFVGALGLFDKPDQVCPQYPTIAEPSIDLFACDIADTNVFTGMYRSRYLDPHTSRMPLSKQWTISDYARIPGLRQPAIVFSTTGQSVIVNCIQLHPDNSTYKIPLDYSYICSKQWRGSIKVALTFYTSSFISARFVMQYINGYEFSGSYGPEYDNGISKVIDVKGDTVDTFTLPWLSHKWWSSQADPQFQLSCQSVIVSSNTVTSPIIYCLVWVAGGDDIQFAYPAAALPAYWSGEPPPSKKGKEREAQAAVQGIFSRTFPPVGEDNFYDIDRGYATSELLGPITDICKRYSPMGTSTGASPFPPPMGVPPNMLDTGFPSVVPTGTTASSDFAYNYCFRQTLFGSWRAAFLFRSGGYRYRFYNTANGTAYTGPSLWTVNDQYGSIPGTLYVEGTDRVARLTVPYVCRTPFGVLFVPKTSDESINGLGILQVSTYTPSPSSPQYIAARDDLQLGYPILPSGFQTPTATVDFDTEFAELEKEFELEKATFFDDYRAAHASRDPRPLAIQGPGDDTRRFGSRQESSRRAQRGAP
jgi:hypothetical protein